VDFERFGFVRKHATGKKMIEKIEELTLYIIELNKKNEALTERVRGLETSKHPFIH